MDHTLTIVVGKAAAADLAGCFPVVVAVGSHSR